MDSAAPTNPTGTPITEQTLISSFIKQVLKLLKVQLVHFQLQLSHQSPSSAATLIAAAARVILSSFAIETALSSLI